jgi:acyl-CoA synthetase (AMP-forming)/AMP-acid ligase II
VVAGLRAIVDSAGLVPSDLLVQWVPTHHDMGLFGLLAPYLIGGGVHVFDPWTFLRHPGTVLRHLAAHRGTLVTGPNFSYDILASAYAADPGDLDLSSWRIAFNGAEPVLADTVDRFTTAFAPAGVPPSTMYPVYGMAEATLAIAFPAPGDGPRIIHVDSDALGATGSAVPVPAGSRSAGKALVSVGRPVVGIQVRLVADGRPCPDGQLGEIQVQGEPVMSGYHNDADATRAAFDGPWLRTGDLGVRLDGELFVTGRRKEMIIVHGRNYFPEDAEAAVRSVPGVHRQRCVAVADTTPGAEHLVIVAETDLPPRDHPHLARTIRARIADELGLRSVRVHLVAARWLTRTDTGKWQRLAAARRLGES